MLHFHSKKPEFLKQEIYASLIMYNFGIFIVNEAEQTIQRQKKIPRTSTDIRLISLLHSKLPGNISCAVLKTDLWISLNSYVDTYML